MRIGNTYALNTYNVMNKNQTLLQKSMEKLSSGLRINRAADDAAGLAISEKMRAQIRGLDQSSRNMQDAISLVQTAEGGLNEVHSLLQRGRELAVQVSNGTLSPDDKNAIQDEMKQLTEEIDNISANTKFNNRSILRSSGNMIPVPTVPSDTGSTGSTPTEPPVTEPTPTEPPVTEPTPDPVTEPTSPATPPPALTEEDQIIQALQSQYLEQSANMIEQYYGLSVTNTDMKVFIDDVNSPGMVAYVSYYVGGDGKGFNLELHLDKSDFLPADGFNTGANAPIYNDRIIAHEMTHAVMSQTMNYSSLPKWFKEGTAEFIQGADERLYADIYYNGTSGVVNSIGDGTDSTWVNASKNYSAGYTAVKYLHEHIKAAGGEGIKDVMDYLSTNQSATLDQALKNIPNGAYSGGLTAFVSDYKVNGATFINSLNLTNSDTGAIGGYDADGGTIKTAENVVADVSNWQEQPVEGFNFIWMNQSSAYTGFTSPYQSFDFNTALSSANPLNIQTGPNSGNSFALHTSDITLGKLGLANIDVTASTDTLIDKFDDAIEMVSSERSRYGAIQNRFEHAISVTNTTSENLVNAESRIRDVDMAREMMNLTKRQILQNASQSMLSQANQQSQSVLQLLR